MSGDEMWTDSPSEVPAPPPVPKKQMSGCMLATLILGSVGLVCMVACCGVLVWVGYAFMPVTSNVPGEVTAIGHQILNIDLPEEFLPENAVTFDNMFFAMKIAQFKRTDGKGDVLLSWINPKYGQVDPNQLPQNQVRDQLQRQILDKLDVKATTSRDITINGQKTSVTIAEAQERATGKAVHTATASFKGPTGEGAILIRLDDDVWDEEAIVEMLESAKPSE